MSEIDKVNMILEDFTNILQREIGNAKNNLREATNSKISSAALNRAIATKMYKEVGHLRLDDTRQLKMNDMAEYMVFIYQEFPKSGSPDEVKVAKLLVERFGLKPIDG